MSSSFARRLLLVTTLEIAAVLWSLVLVGALLAFSAYVGVVRAEQTATLDRVTDAMVTPASQRDARVAGRLAAARYPRSSVVVLLVDAVRRVDVYQPASHARPPVIDVRKRGDAGGEPVVAGTFAQLVIGLATVFGLTLARAHLGSIDILVKSNGESLVGVVSSYVPEFCIALALALGISFVLARALTRQVLRPLVDVTAALERFAAGDLSPQPIVADARQSLGTLAVAYNGAIAQMERAFAERDRANGRMRQFVADAGHQLRTPLTVVRGFIAILRKGELRTPEDRARILDTMNRQSQIMASLIDKLMLLDRWDSDPERGRPVEAIDVGRLVEDVVTPIADLQPARNVRIDAPSGPLAAIDPSDLTHAITNILDNALKYTPGEIDVAVRESGSRVIVEIADRGPGMSREEVAHAFDRFFRGARRDVDGSGLGLSIARRALERAGGTLSLESDPELGSRFTLSLPAAARREGSAAPEFART
ncbi:MAG: HAMP domain-containing histidine kinase [Candidatus Eremiobacteraeota bacterium]|nr:HAMP domain-containing histidine kinase [Candidatus Eremiobacteraeota bacterium]